MKYVYHSSIKQNLKFVKPKISTHKKSWVYAMRKPEQSLMFLGNFSDLINQIGFTNDVFFIAERFKNSLEYAYKNKEGSVYKLEGSSFIKNSTSFSQEMISENEASVISEQKIEDALSEILKLEKEGKVKIYRYPELPDFIPGDKSDLVDKVVSWIPVHGQRVLEDVKKFHPDILDKIIKKINIINLYTS